MTWNRTFNFKTQIEVGKKGEDRFALNYHDGKLQKLDGKSPIGDFMRPDGRIIELKTDTYPMARTPNYFMEFHSNQEKKTPGGPWRTFLQGADIFVYLYTSDGVYFQFEDLQRLVHTLDELIKKKKLKVARVVNKTWVTTGYKIEREWVKDLCTEHRLEEGKEVLSEPT